MKYSTRLTWMSNLFPGTLPYRNNIEIPIAQVSYRGAFQQSSGALPRGLE